MTTMKAFNEYCLMVHGVHIVAECSSCFCNVKFGQRNMATDHRFLGTAKVMLWAHNPIQQGMQLWLKQMLRWPKHSLHRLIKSSSHSQYTSMHHHRCSQGNCLIPLCNQRYMSSASYVKLKSDPICLDYQVLTTDKYTWYWSCSMAWNQ